MDANGLPNHETGLFPNSGNPHTIEEQDVSLIIPLETQFVNTAINARIPGVGINGIVFEPETAEVVECNDSDWRIEAIQDYTNLGLDFNDAHVQPGGIYHYHGVPTALIDEVDNGKDLVHIGFASDGSFIYYSNNGTYTPSYQLKSGERSASGTCTYRNKTVIVDNTDYDGTYVQDWQYVAGLGDLDACNGIEINGEYVYIITDEYPYVPRCTLGLQNSTFSHAK